MKLTLTQDPTHYTTDKNGAKLLTKKGKPYVRCYLKTKEYGAESLSGFGSETTQGWKKGQEIEADVVEVKSADGTKTFFNFKLPERENAGGMSQADRDTLTRIELTQERIISGIKEVLAILQTETDKINYPVSGNDMPDFGPEN